VADNRRSSTRHSVSIPTKLTVDGAATESTMINLSLGGALIAGVKLAMGKRLQVLFDIPTAEASIDIGATVRWADDAGIGVQFDGLRARDVWALNEYFKQLA
jgi:hypothetical protein